MYENEIYSGSGAGTNTSGAYSGENTADKKQDYSTQYRDYTSGQAGSYGAGNYSTGSQGSTAAGNYSTGGQESNGTGSYSTGSYHTWGSAAATDSTGSMHSNGAGREPKKKGGFVKKAMVSVSLGLLFGLFAGIGFYAVELGSGALDAGRAGDSVETTGTLQTDTTDSGISMVNTNNVTVVDSDVSSVVEEVMPAMVSIVNSYTETGMNIFGQTYSQDGESGGSGIIVSENEDELLIVTNYHVVQGANTLKVTFLDNTEAEASIKGTDSDMDLAVIAIPLDSLSQDTRDSISIATLGNSDTLKLGEPVIAIGNALGYGQSVTNGIVSALDREIVLENGSTGTFIQTNAAINHGNSGGALLNIKGEVVGINSNKISGSSVEGMGYAIPISSASPIIADLMERQTRSKVAEGETGYLGITLQEVTDQISAMFNMPEGVYVLDAEEGSAAEKAGIVSGDIITEFDGESIDSYSDLQKVLEYYGAGDSAVITVMRSENGQYVPYELEITLGSRPSENH